MMTVLFFLMVLVPNDDVQAKEPNAKDCLEGTIDCTDEDDSLLEGLDENSEDSVVQSNSSLGLDLFKMVVVLVFILVLIYFTLKFINKRNKLFHKASVLENLGGISVGQNKSVQLIRIGSKVYLIGVGDNVELLEEIQDKDVKEDLLRKDEGEPLQASTIVKSLFRPNEDKEEKKTNEFKQSFQQELEKLKKNRNEMILKHKKENRHE